MLQIEHFEWKCENEKLRKKMFILYRNIILKLRRNVIPFSEVLQPRFRKLACGGIGVDSDTVWNDAQTPQATRMVSHW